MKKIIYLFSLVTIFSINNLFAQTVSLADIEANIGEEVLVPLEVEDLPGAVGAISIFIDFDNVVLSFDTIVITVPELEGMQIGLFPTSNPETISLQWFSLTGGVTLDNGKILDLRFVYNGGTSDLTIDPGSQIADPLAIPYDNITFVNGSVFGQGGPETSVWNGTGNWSEDQYWSNGLPGSETDATIESGEVTIASGANCDNLTINESTVVNIEPNFFLLVLTDFTNNGTFNILSDETGSGSFICNGTIINNGDINIERYLDGSRSYFVSSPITDANADVYSGLEVKRYDEPNQQWILLDGTDPMDVGSGYQVTTSENNTFTYSGNLTNAEVEIADLTYTTGGTDYPAGMNLIGNPFTTAIKWNQGDWIKENINAAIYVWNGSHFVTWNGSIGALTEGIIPAMQGFAVFANDAEPSITIPISSRLQSDQAFYKNGKNQDEKATSISLLLEGNGYEDHTFIAFNPQASYEFDNDYDAYKLFGIEQAPQFYTFAKDGTPVSINEFPSIDANNDTAINLGIKTSSNGEIKIVLMEYSIFRPIAITDLETNTYQDLRKDSVFTVSLQSGTYDDRFVIQLDTITGISENRIDIGQVYSYGNTIQLNLKETNKKIQIQLYDLKGRELYNELIFNAFREEITVNFKSGLYIIRVIGDQGYYTEKLYISN
jgi:hypothetical protein